MRAESIRSAYHASMKRVKKQKTRSQNAPNRSYFFRKVKFRVDSCSFKAKQIAHPARISAVISD